MKRIFNKKAIKIFFRYSNLRKLFFVVIALQCTSLTLAQERNLSGIVKDETGASIPYVSVVLKGTPLSCETDSAGVFNLKIPDNAALEGQLIFKLVGYKTQEIAIKNQSYLTVILQLDVKELEEIVVLGYGIVKKRDLTGAIATIAPKDFNKGNFAAPDQLIQGKISGVQITTNNGLPGAPTTVKIRGNSAITGTGQPLFVIDGVPLDGRAVESGVNPLNFLNTSDIAAIEVLKDASATAIYGSRAAYGVVIITTKSGQIGQTKIEIGATTGISTYMDRVKVLEAPQYRIAIPYYDVNKNNDKGSNVNPIDAITQNAWQQNYNIAISGGSENSKYRLSTGVLNQNGIIQNTGLKKYSTNLASNFTFLNDKKLGIDINAHASQYIQNREPSTGSAGTSAIIYALVWNPTYALQKEDGSYNNAFANPLAWTELYKNQAKVTSVLGSVSPYFKLTDWLEYRFLYSINYNTGITRAATNQALQQFMPVGAASISNTELTTQQITHTLNIRKEIAPHLKFNGVLGYEYMSFDLKGYNITAFGLPNTGFGDFGLDYTNYIQYSDPTRRSVSSFIDPKTALQSYFGRSMLNFKDRYLLTATIRADGSSKFGTNNKYGYFPSFSAAWQINEEPFFQSEFINNLKIRSSWGKTGNQEFPAGSSQARYAFLSGGGIGQVNNPNPDLKWQSDGQWDIGLDIALLNNRLSATIDYFSKKTTDLLFPSAPIQPAPASNIVRWINLDGNIINKGLELSFNAHISQKLNFNWDVSANITFLKNTVSGLPSPIFTGNLEGSGISGTLVQTIQNGLPMNAFYTRKFIGWEQSTGQAIYEDNGNTFYYTGNPNPRTLLGFSTKLRYKNLSLEANLYGALGQSIFNNLMLNILNVGGIAVGNNIALSVFQNPIKESIANPVTPSSRYIENGSYLKMANLTLAYDLGYLLKQLKSANIFLSGQNLFILTKYSGFDPEVNANKSERNIPSLGIDVAQYPSARTVIFGLNFSF